MKSHDFANDLLCRPNVDIFCDTKFGWNTPDNTSYVDPELVTYSDESGDLWGLEITPSGYAPMNLETIQQVMNCSHLLGFSPKLTEEQEKTILNFFKNAYE